MNSIYIELWDMCSTKKKWKHTLLKAYMFKIFSRIKTESTNWKKKDKVGTKKYSTFDFDAWVLLSLSHSGDKEMFCLVIQIITILISVCWMIWDIIHHKTWYSIVTKLVSLVEKFKTQFQGSSIGWKWYWNYDLQEKHLSW